MPQGHKATRAPGSESGERRPLASFGGPAAHPCYFRDEFVVLVVLALLLLGPWRAPSWAVVLVTVVLAAWLI